jgi:hypothetical protein
MYQYNYCLTQLFTKYKYIWLWLQYIGKNIECTVYTTVWFIILSKTTIFSAVYGQPQVIIKKRLKIKIFIFRRFLIDGAFYILTDILLPTQRDGLWTFLHNVWLQCFDPYLGHRQAYIMNWESAVHEPKHVLQFLSSLSGPDDEPYKGRNTVAKLYVKRFRVHPVVLVTIYR